MIMRLGGLMKLTLLDFPGRVACTVFTGGCNLCCPFCHNSGIVTGSDKDEISEEEFLFFLTKRRGILDGVCVSGGEPLIQSDIIGFLQKIKELGYAVKLDTNGTMPDMLREAAEGGYCDSIAMDIKNSPQRYAETVGVSDFDMSAIYKSAEYIMNCGCDYEFRTTVVREFHTVADIIGAAEIIRGAKKYFLQPFRDSDGVMRQGLHTFDENELQILLKAARTVVPRTKLRGV